MTGSASIEAQERPQGSPRGGPRASILYRGPGARIVLYKLPDGNARSLRDVLGKGGRVAFEGRRRTAWTRNVTMIQAETNASCLDRDLRIADPLVAGRAHTTRHLYKSSLRPAILILIHVP